MKESDYQIIIQYKSKIVKIQSKPSLEKDIIFETEILLTTTIE